MPRLPFIDPNFIVVELIFSVIVIILAMLVYFRTKEMYDLTKHKGISYFRNAFLFFALAFLFRYLFHFFKISRFLFDLHISQKIISPVSLVFTGYLSTIAIFYLILSTLWKKTKNKNLLFIAHATAIIISVIVAIFRTSYVLIIAQLALLVFAAVLAYVSYKSSKKHSNIFIIHILIFIIWIFNIFILCPRILILPFELRLLSQLISIIFFGIIYFKVNKWTK